MKKESFAGMKVLVMGLGLHGGGVESARYLAGLGAEVSVTDLRDEKTLAPSMEKLKSFPVHYILGRHETADFKNADIVIKNPGVRPDSPYLKAARRIETDISLFLAACPARISAVTGTKGKSTASSAMYWVLNESRTIPSGALPNAHSGNAHLGGNIAVSPLIFLDSLKQDDDVVLELSSFQLGDLRGRKLLKPRASVITCILRDHLDRYGTMETYVADKRLIYKDQNNLDVTVAADDEWGKSFHRETPGRGIVFSEEPLGEGISGGWIADPKGPGFARLWETPSGTAGGGEPGSVVEVVPERPLIPGRHQKRNLLAAALALLDLGLPPLFIKESLSRFPGVEHRLEFFCEAGGIRFYNDTAATIPDAAVSAINAFDNPQKSLVLVCGGTDKDLDFSILAAAAAAAKAVVLLSGSGTDKLKALFDSGGVKYRGPFESPEDAAKSALDAAASGDTVLFSPGCASFGMFLNEFDRGKKWKAAVQELVR